MNVSDVMVSAVITVKPDATVQEAGQLMLANRVSGLPVVDDSAKLVGLISEGDLLRRAAEETWPKAWGPPPRRGWAKLLMGPEERDTEYVTQQDRKVGDIMTRDVVSAAPETSISEIAALLVHHRIKLFRSSKTAASSVLSVARILLRRSRGQTCEGLPGVSIATTALARLPRT